MLLGLLHQGFHAYAENLPSAVRHEWEKVAGRFDEIVFDQPLAHTAALVSGAGREQGVPEFWDPTRLGAWAANLFAIAVFVPIFEESLCRGLGYALFEPLGALPAVLITAVAFTIAHGVIVDIPVILATGIGLGYMRAATGSIYPCIALHGFFNGFGLVVAALVARG